MVEHSDEQTYVHELYRYARLLGAEHDAAMAAIEQTCSDVLGKTHAGADAERVKIMMFLGVRAKLVRRGRGTAGGKRTSGDFEGNEPGIDEVRAALTALPEPGRTALVLLYLNVFSRESLQRLLGVELRELAQILGKAREALQPACEPLLGSPRDSAP